MNMFYIQIAFFLLSIFVYVNNKTLAAETASEENTKTKPQKCYPTSEEIYKKNKNLLCTDPKETKNAVEFMEEAVTHFKYHASDLDHFQRCAVKGDCYVLLFKKKHEGHTDFQKIQYTLDDSNDYNELINKLWDPDSAKFFNASSVKRKIIRVYNPNLVLIQQRYKNSIFGRWKYFYALVTKVEVTKYVSLIVMASVNVNDHNPSNKEFKNTIIESANSFKIDVDSESDIRKGKLKKTFVNVAGYYLQKYNTIIDVIFVGSINGHSCI
ncbi:fam-a protein [Plasmodium vinckei lentum]|uniref:Fam-a protein n=1 Tax=Plasmodium vinckei lentum TaxID=138297 RepID=A0A6V7S882_PLAVN|nr:fam-a protein [Plasmodium vinckei lentum]